MIRNFLLATALCGGLLHAGPVPDADAQIRMPQPAVELQQPPKVAVETVLKARLDRIYGVDTSDKACRTYRPEGLTNPVIYRTDADKGRQIEIFAADTGLVLVGDNLDLVNSLVMKYDNGRVVKGEIVSRRDGKTACGEQASQSVIVSRFKLPAETSVQYASLEIYAQEGTRLTTSLTGTDPKTKPALLTEAHNTKIHPKPVFGPVDLPERSVYPGQEIAWLMTSRNIGLFNLATLTDRTLRQSPATTGVRMGDTIRGKTSLFVSTTTAFGRYEAALMPGMAMTRQPETGAPAPAMDTQPRYVSDTAWAGSDATGYATARAFGNTNVVVSIIPRPRSEPDQPDGNTDGPSSSPIKAFDPGNRLFQVGGNTTDGDTHLSALVSEAWCEDLLKQAPDPQADTGFVYGEIQLPPIRWGVENSGSSTFTGLVRAELQKDRRTKDTMRANVQLSAGQTRLETYDRTSEPVPVAWDTVGQLCYYVGHEQDEVVENGAWTVQVLEPGSDNERIVSAN